MEITIREATVDDMPHIAQLIQELATFEKEEDAVEITVEDLVKDGFGTDKKFHCFVADQANKVVGMALVYMRYSTWKGAALHLEDLIVTEPMRGTGLGTALLNKVVTYGKQLGVKRICWEVLDWNEPAIKFYQSKGANVMRDWDVVHLDEKAIETYIAAI